MWLQAGSVDGRGAKAAPEIKCPAGTRGIILFHEVTVIWRKLENGSLRKAFNKRMSVC